MISLSSNTYHTRFQGAPWYRENPAPLTLIGLGGIGSWVSLFLSRIGHPMSCYDMDFVDDTNMAGQLYQVKDIGLSKVAASRNIAGIFSDHRQMIDMGKFSYGNRVGPITICAVDDMVARKNAVGTWYHAHSINLPNGPCIFIDGRMSVESFQVFAITTTEQYDEYLTDHMFDNKDVPDASCSFKATSHVGAHIGAVITEVLNNYLTNYYTGEDIREVPFMTQIDTPFMLQRCQ